MLTAYLHFLLTKRYLTAAETEEAMSLILEGADPHQIAAFLSILKYRGISSDEILGMVRALEKKSIAVSIPYPTLDIVGTGGDMASTVNISTGAAILTAACGVPITKHGNRASSSLSGSADVLEALGINVEIPPEKIQECLQKCNIAFLFAPLYHPLLKKISPVRKSLKIPTVFNILGPLLNPVKTEYALIGVADISLLELIAQVVAKCPHKKRALVFHGSGLDELTTLGSIEVYDIQDGQITRLTIDPKSLGFTSCSLQELQGGDASLNASILKDVFSGKKCAVADALIFNAGAALWIFNKANTLIEGVSIARQVLEEGKALTVLKKMGDVF